MIRENASTSLAENALNQTHSRCVCFEAKFDRAYYRGITESKRIRDTGYLPAYSTSEFIVIMGEKEHFAVPVQERWVEEISVEELARYGPLAEYMRASAKIPGWLRGEEAKAMASLVSSLPDNCVVVEIGSFLGSSSVLLGAALKLRGSGKLHCVDPFDGSGDAFSVPIYNNILEGNGGKPLRQCFHENIHAADLQNWVEVHQGSADEISKSWLHPIDLLFLDGDHSPQGARSAYESWFPMLKIGGIIAIHNSNPREYAKDHNGSRLLALEEIHPPVYTDIHLVETTTFARKVATGESFPH